uniref:Uncharacterized protein n=1 Tax=Auxenochlorella protothecoides TaxID=3075 RepID=A0A1D2AEF4_AUXPR
MPDLHDRQEHIRASLPLVVASRQQLAEAQQGLQDGLYAARGAEEFASTLSAVLPGALERLQAALTQAIGTAAAAAPARSTDASTLARSLDRLGLRSGAPLSPASKGEGLV